MSDTRGFSYYGKTPSGVEMALTLDVDAGKKPAEIAAYLKAVDLELKAAGFTRSDRLDKPAGGWGGGKGQQPRPETPPPAGIVRPDHCDAPMRYVKYRKDGAPGAPARNLDPGWKDMWVCSKDKGCEDVTSGKSEKAAASECPPMAPVVETSIEFVCRRGTVVKTVEECPIWTLSCPERVPHRTKVSDGTTAGVRTITPATRVVLTTRRPAHARRCAPLARP